ncbi:MAG: SpoIVB peptidase S55 domain-containing protein [Candidatus Gallimonas sp.]
MRKLKFLFAVTAIVTCVGISGLGARVTACAANDEYYVGGMAAGFLLNAGGAQVIGLNDVVSESGVFRPAERAGIRSGDLICAADGAKIATIADLNAALDRSGGNSVRLTIKRGGECVEANVLPAKDAKNGKYKIGVLIRDTVSGIGTVTYVNKQTKRFGALGHAVTDENRDSFSVSDSQVYLCSVIGVNRGVRGQAGELRGLFVNDRTIARAEKVCDCGLYGTFTDGYDFSACETAEIAPIAQATIGKAAIYSTTDGVTPKRYEIAIAKVDANNRENKNFVIKITDETLIGETGGIVQGMSGSPIVQNGKLIGAVTHVFLNDPTRGYGIGIEHMICE